MIRPVLYVDLPGIIFALDQRARTRHGEFANFVVAPEIEEPRSGFSALLSALLPITPDALTWICEDRWRLLGLAQARRRPGAQAWDLAYLAAMSSPGGQPPTISQDEVLLELLQYSLNVAITRGVHRFFARVEDELPELELFGKLSFQRYASELTYCLGSPAEALARLDQLEEAAHDVALLDDRRPIPLLTRFRSTQSEAIQPEDPEAIRPDVPLRRWHRHDAWGLLRLYDACTPKRVQLAESLTSDELVHTRAAGGRTWYLPLLEPTAMAFVNDRGVRLGGWMRLRFGRGAQPHMLSVMTHPDDADVAPALLRFALRILAREAPRPVVCEVRDYETAVVDALRAAGFEHIGTHALLVRHLTTRALRRRAIPALEPHVVYGVKGLGTAQSRLSEGEKTYYAGEND
ncbi:MAG TPA: hypothetical protein VGP82_13225 [Ktedonobacterales bacterium]|jgi:hypothetical protein|nr:hypothetical protein [Ktedonobacterales bacterium]